MALYRTISLSFWTDSKVEDDFTPEDRYFYLYLLTNPHTNLCGCYEISKRQMSNETGYNIDTIERLIERFTKTHGVIAYDDDTKEILIVNWSRYNWTKSQKFLKAVVRDVERIKNDDFRKYVDNLLRGYGINVDKYPIDTSDLFCSVTDTNTVTVTDTVTDTATDTATGNARAREKSDVVSNAHEEWKKAMRRNRK